MLSLRESQRAVLQSARLFTAIGETDLDSLLACLGARLVQAERDSFLLRAGDSVHSLGLVLSGALHVSKENTEGERVLIAALSPGDCFAEALCCAGIAESPVSVVAAADSAVLLLDFQRLLHNCPRTCAFHTKLIENMLGMLAQKNLSLQGRMEVLGHKTLRRRILHYLQPLSAHPGSNVYIPFNREELAEYLCVDRSALSHELGRMKQDGLLDYHKNCFRLL